MRTLLLINALLALLLAAQPSHAEDDGWIDLLAGDTLDAWRGFKKDHVPEAWSLEDGVLTLNGSGGDLITREKFRDFDFRFEWRISPGGNSGVMYRVSEDQETPYMTGPEYQVLDDKRHNSDLSTMSGSIYGLYARDRGAPRKPGEWNKGRIVINHGRLEHWLNGAKVAEAQIGSDDWNQRVANSKFDAWKQFGRNAEGHLDLQDHGNVVSYRNLRVRRLNEADSVSGNQPKRLLFVTQSSGFMHSTVNRKQHEYSHAEQIMQQLGIRSGAFRVDCTQDVATDFTPELLANYDTVAFYTTGDLPMPQETLDWFLETWLAEQGHSFLGIHSAADTYHNHQPFWDMIGGTFQEHPWTWDTDVVLKLHDGDHPASRVWGAEGDRVPFTDEIYLFKNWQPEKVRVLMSLDMERTELKRPLHIPVLWVKPYGAGRVMHMSLGHREDVWTNPVYQESLIGGIRWLTGQASGDAAPNPAVSAAEQAAAERATSSANALSNGG